MGSACGRQSVRRRGTLRCRHGRGRYHGCRAHEDLDAVVATADEKAVPRPGDEVVGPADVVMDRAFTLDHPPAMVWPWLVQLGKRRAGWYLPAMAERLLPPSRRATRTIVGRWQQLQVGDVIPDYGGRDVTCQVAAIDPPTSLVYRSRRGHTNITWSLTLVSLPAADARRRSERTRVCLRLRMAPVRHRWLARSVGELIDLLTIDGMAAGLRERLAESLRRS